MTWKSLAPYRDVLLPLVHEQYKNSSNLLSLIEELGNQGDTLDAISQELFAMLDIYPATGATLDIIGRIGNVPRLGRIDPVYRKAIITELGTLRSGTPEDIIGVVKRITGASSVQYIPSYPAGFWVVPSSNGSVLTQDTLDAIAPAGVQAFPPCFLVDAHGTAIVDATRDWVLVVGPCADIVPEEPYLIFDGGVGDTPDFTTFDSVDGGIGDYAPVDVVYDYGGGPG